MTCGNVLPYGRRLALLIRDTRYRRISFQITPHPYSWTKPLADPGLKGNLFSFRRPDVSVHCCLERGSKLSTRDVLVAIEIVSPGTEQTDLVQKVAEYAREQIPVYLVVTLDDDFNVKLVHEYRLDWSSKNYQLVAVHENALELSDPFLISVLFSELDRA